MADKTANKRGFSQRFKGVFKKWLTDPNATPKTELAKIPDETTETSLVHQPLDEWQHRFDTLYIPEEIRKRATSYEQRQQFLTHTDEENLEICQDKKQFINHRYDKAAQHSFWGVLISLSVGGLCVWVGLSPMFWALIAGLGVGSKYFCEKLAYHEHMAEMAIERQSSLEECEDALNKYAFLLVDAVKYINAQISLWNLRYSYLNNELAEPTDQDRLRCKQISAIRHDFEKSIKRLEHLYYLKGLEKIFSEQGVELDRLHSGLNEHLNDLTPIVPKIATDPLMLEAIRDAEAIFAENSEQELSEKIENLKAMLEEPLTTEATEIVIEEDAENKDKLP